MTTVSLFSGCLGLDLGLEALGIKSDVFVENDSECLRLIAERRPGARVMTDVRDVTDALLDEVGEVEFVAGGFPCQDLSYAGRGAGLDGDRSGLWFEMIRIVRDLRPRLVLVENVPGLLTRGLHVVVHDLARAGYVGRWFTLGAVDVGAPHRRERVFVLARRVTVGRGEAMAGGHPSGLFDPAGWMSPQESLFDAEPLLRLGKRGRWTLDSVYEDDHRLAIDDDSDETLLPTPNAYESTPTEDFLDELRDADLQADARLYLPGRKHHVQRTLSRIVPVMDQVGEERQEDERLLPTPGAWLGRRPENATADPERAASRRHEGTRGKRSIELPDALAAEVEIPGRLLPTPVRTDGRGNTDGYSREGGSSLRELRHLLPTPAARDGKGANPNEREGGLDLPAAIEELPDGAKLLPTPVVTDSFGGRRSTARTEEWTSHPGTSLTDAVWEAQGREEDTRGKLLPTPTVALADGGQKTRGGDRQDELLLGGIAEAAAEGRLPLLPTPVANPDNPGAGGELRAAITHGPGRRNETGIDTMGRPNDGRPSRKDEALLPTPTAAAGENVSEQGPRFYQGEGDNPTLLGAARRVTDTSKLLPTPQASDADGGRLDRNPETVATGRRPSGSKVSVPLATALDHETDADPEETRWGVYEPAVRRWEAIVGIDAPVPTDEKGRLSPEFVEWMLGYEPGWTALDGVSRTARLRMLGNSVQVQVGERVGAALLALDRLLADCPQDPQEACA